MYNCCVLMEKKISLLFLCLFLVIGFLLRFARLDKIPAGLHSDEAHAGYNAFLLLKSGKNLNGDPWPIDIDSFGDYRPALVSYLTVPGVAILGLNEFSTRAPVALFGFLLILLTFKFSLEIFEDKKAALLASGLLALSPMAVIFSRATSEAVLEVFFEFAALLFVILGFKNKNPWWFLGSFIFWLLAYFSYHTSRVLTFPLGAVTVVLSYLQFKPQKKLLILAISTLFGYFLFPWLYFLGAPVGQGRVNQVNVFVFPEVQRSINEALTQENSSTPFAVSRFFHNKVIGYSLDISSRYASFFSPDLILYSLPKPDRYFVPQVGAITLAEFAGLLFSLGYFLFKKPKPLPFLPLVILLLAPLPSAVTFEDAPNFQRAVFLFPAWQLVASFGLILFWKNLSSRWKTISAIALVLIAFSQSLFFWHQYTIHEPKTSRSIFSRTTEMKTEAAWLNANRSKKILLSEHDAPYLFYLYYNQINIFDTNFERISHQKYFTGDYKINNMTFSKYLCLPPEAVFNEKYDLIIFNEGCQAPIWAQKLFEFRRSDGSLASAAFKPDDKAYSYFSSLYKQSPDSLEISKSFIKLE